MKSDKQIPSRTFCALPELVDLLGPELNPIDLASSARVSRLWYHVLTPYLWSVVNESQYSWSKDLATHDAKSVQACFLKYGYFIRELHVHSQAMLDIVSGDGVCSKLRVLKIYDPTDKEPGAQYVDPAGKDGNLWDFVHSNKDLETLWFGGAVKRLLENASVSVCDIVLLSLKNLVTLHDYTGALEPPVILERLSNLRSFLGNGLVFAKALDLDVHIQIRSLELTNYIEGRTFLVLLNRLRSLDHIAIAGLFDVGRTFHQDVEALLVNTPLRLKGFHLRRQDPRDIDHELATWIFPQMPHLTEFGARMLCPKTAQALATHATQLQVFRQSLDGNSIHIYYKPCPLLNVANILFQSCTKLRVFDGIHHKIEGDKMFERPWVCRELEVFRCQIVGLTRLTSHEEALLEILAKLEQKPQPFRPTPSMAIGESEAVLERQQKYRDRLKTTQANQKDQHHRVYNHLAGLRMLQTLDLGYEYRHVHPAQENNPRVKMVEGQAYIWYDGEPIINTLELTLASGFDRLATLTRLEVFGFEGVDHRIGRQELEWIATSWPRLKEMRGLHEELLPRCEPDSKRDELRKIMQGLRNDVRHRAKRQ
ncbi:hypothetical protein F5H01DRAFT_339564 [Linnemannia elongata]|nr:hypothetical protein F5H01DRAFT_339564 [Linnemannia elongata]